MRWIVLAAVAVTTFAGLAAYMDAAQGQADVESAPIYGIKIPAGYRDWRLISVNHLAGAGGKLKQVRAQLGNDVAITAFRDGKLPFPDEYVQAPRSWTEKAYHNLIYFNQAEQGGHFAAWEQPQLFSDELRAAFRTLR